MKKWQALSVLLMILILSACGKEESSPALAENEILFNVDSTLVQSAYSPADFAFRFHPPVKWDALSDEMLREVHTSLKPYLEVTADFQIRPLQFFLHPEKQSLLVVSHIAGADTAMAPTALLDSYTTAVRTTFALNNIEEHRYTKAGLPMIQYMLQKQENIVFKILFSDSSNQLIQLDYVVPRSIFMEEAKAIESSIGTICIQ